MPPTCSTRTLLLQTPFPGVVMFLLNNDPGMGGPLQHLRDRFTGGPVHRTLRAGPIWAEPGRGRTAPASTGTHDPATNASEVRTRTPFWDVLRRPFAVIDVLEVEVPEAGTGGTAWCGNGHGVAVLYSVLSGAPTNGKWSDRWDSTSAPGPTVVFNAATRGTPVWGGGAAVIPRFRLCGGHHGPPPCGIGIEETDLNVGGLHADAGTRRTVCSATTVQLMDRTRWRASRWGMREEGVRTVRLRAVRRNADRSTSGIGAGHLVSFVCSPAPGPQCRYGATLERVARHQYRYAAGAFSQRFSRAGRAARRGR